MTSSNNKMLELLRIKNRIVSNKSKRNLFLNPIISKSKRNVALLLKKSNEIILVDNNNNGGFDHKEQADKKSAGNSKHHKDVSLSKLNDGHQIKTKDKSNTINTSAINRKDHRNLNTSSSSSTDERRSTAVTSTQSSNNESSRNNSNNINSWLNPSPVTFPQNEHEAVLLVLYCLTNNITLNEIQNIIKYYPSCLSCTNTYGQTPLHVALMRGIRCDIIRYILYKFPQACWIVDDYGKLPLHYAATSSKWIISLNDNDNEAIYDKHYIKMLNELCITYPQGTTHEDNDGMNPIELCLLDDILPNQTFMKLLQKTSIKYWRKINNTKKQDVKTSTGVTTTTTTTAGMTAQTPATESQRRSIAGCAA